MLFSLKFRSKIQICKVFKVRNQKLTTSGKLEPILQNFFFFVFFFFGVKLGHFTINTFFSVCNKNASLPVKNGEILHKQRKKVW